MKHEKRIHEFLALFHEPWMDESYRQELDKEILSCAGHTMEDFDASIEAGVINGYSVDVQLELMRKVVPMIKAAHTRRK